MPRSDRPKRKKIPLAVECAVWDRQEARCWCDHCLKMPQEDRPILDGEDVELNHSPPLGLRLINDAGTDYIPPQLDPNYIYAEFKAHHRAKTSHPRGRHTSIDSDQHAIAKVRRLRGETRSGPKKKITPRPFPKSIRKLSSAPFPKGRKFEKRKKV